MIKRWLERRSRIISDKPHKMQSLIDNKYLEQHLLPRDSYNRLSEVPRPKIVWR